MADLNRNRTRRRKEILGEWVHQMRMEMLRVPIMVPIWWEGMKLCDVLWKLT